MFIKLMALNFLFKDLNTIMHIVYIHLIFHKLNLLFIINN